MKTNPFGKQGWTPENIDNLERKTFLITGANAGTGFEAAKILLSKGAEVVMLNRNNSKSTKAISDLKEQIGAHAKVSFIKTDLASLSSVRQAAAEINKTIPRIDALLCNAAIAQVPKQTFTVDGFESQLGVNHYGHFLLCGLLYQKLKASHGRIVVVASEGYKMGIKTIQFDDINWDNNYHPNKVYSQSKLAQMMFAYELQDRLKGIDNPINIYVCHPGASATTLIKNSGSLRDRIIFGIMSKTPLVQSAEKGAYPEVMCATEAAEHLNQKGYYGPTGRMQWTGPVGACKLEPHAQDKAVMEKLWNLSEKETNFKWIY
ncbi:SDR family oxidoreductase [Winogradskyella eckloniae]|uniref:SDR family oxidoreductase n=1 Tax=Winogradskyella eckloniae TaxID=1089306 RepID=UPI0015652B8F|nr:SDR family oxidoreductase [Winogradskyella eckloniae]NRD21372.1 SDR family oxidoreductase [Winogradskyella eckloniae]